jgi:hypothetical protein
LPWPGQAAHPAGSYKYSYLSYRISGRADINYVADIDITGWFRDHLSLSESNA